MTGVRDVLFHRAQSLPPILATLLLVFAAATTMATAQTYTVLYDFDGVHGYNPVNPGLLAQGRDGSLYGTTSGGGTKGDGVAFKITPSGQFKVLYVFDQVHGSYPYSGLTVATNGNFYGTATAGGNMSCRPYGCGTVFEITPSGSLNTLYAFTGGADGDSPIAPPIQGSDGNFYGTTDAGTMYKIAPSGAFTSLGAMPAASSAPLLQGIDGNFYGTTLYNGSSSSSTVFKLTPKGIVTTVYAFDGPHGLGPADQVIQDQNGNLYGTTAGGGELSEVSWGVVFKLTPQGTETVLHNFGDDSNYSDGRSPEAGLVQATDNNFYGVAPYGGSMGAGVIFQVTPAGDYSILYNFDGTSGAYPMSTPMQHTNGKIYGLAWYGGPSDDGVVYSLDVGLAPFVSFVSSVGKAGKTVEILGQGFTGTTAVFFNGIPTSFKVFSDTFLTAAAPQGVTTGPVTVTTPSGTLTSNKPFRVTPAILSFSPTSGAVGAGVVLTGTGLTQTMHVSFGGVPAGFTVDSDTQVTATVPAGAQTSSIQIVTLGGFAASSAVFTVTQ